MDLLSIKTQKGCVETNIITQKIVIFLNLENELKIIHEQQESVLGANDVLIVNSGATHDINGPQAFFVRFEIDNNEFKSYFPKRDYRFLCDSSSEKNSNFDNLRTKLTQILRCYYDQEEYREAELMQKVCSLLIFIVSNFATKEYITHKDTAAEQLVSYISRNYQEDLSLKRISGDFHMTPQYFSKYFKNNIGVNYYRYLSTVRLKHAVKLLINTEENLLRIALDSGFPNAESFNKYFHEEYGITPLEYRIRNRREQKAQTDVESASMKEALRYLGDIRKEEIITEKKLNIDCSERAPFDKFWAEILNIGGITTLQNAEVREQLKILQAAVRFKNARILLEVRDLNADDFFYTEEHGFDFLWGLKLNIWLVIDYRLCEDKEGVLSYLKKLISHMANRYSIDNVRKWQFELVYNTDFSEQKAAEYWDMYRKIQEVLDRFECRRLIGAGLSLGNKEGLNRFYKCCPDPEKKGMIQTFQSDPYVFYDTEDGLAFARETDGSYLKNRIISLRERVPELTREDSRLYVVSWKNDIYPHNSLSDSCYRGAAIIKSIIDCVGYVNGLAPVMPLDVMDLTNHRGNLLFGGEGMIAKFGIKKPSFYSFEFLCRCGEYYIAKDDNSIVFVNKENYQIVCHNCKNLSYKYYLHEKLEKENNYDEYFDDLTPIRLDYRFEGMKDGEYIVKTRLVSSSCGSIQDNMDRMLKQPNIYIHQNDANYLRDISVPKVLLSKITVSGGKAELSIELPANAFAHVHIIYEY